MRFQFACLIDFLRFCCVYKVSNGYKEAQIAGSLHSQCEIARKIPSKMTCVKVPFMDLRTSLTVEPPFNDHLVARSVNSVRGWMLNVQLCLLS